MFLMILILHAHLVKMHFILFIKAMCHNIDYVMSFGNAKKKNKLENRSRKVHIK